MSVSILSILIDINSSLNSKLIYKIFNPANVQLQPKFVRNKDLPAPDPPANILSSPLLNPPNSFLSNVDQPVLT